MQLLLLHCLADRAAHQNRATAPEGRRQECNKAPEVVAKGNLMLELVWARPKPLRRAQPVSHPASSPVIGAVERYGLLAAPSGCRGSKEVADPPSDGSVDEGSNPSPLGIVGRQAPPQVESELLLVILSCHAREQRSAGEALGVDPDGLAGVGVNDVVAVPQSLHECRRLRGRGHVARSLGGGEFSIDTDGGQRACVLTAPLNPW
jgi:hypothetical protein